MSTVASGNGLLDAITAWLRKYPRAHSLRVTDGNSQQHAVQLNGAQFPRVAETLTALDADVIEALNPEGQVIRAIRVGDFVVPNPPAEPNGAAGSPERYRPLMPPIQATDPETQRVVAIATLIANAYAHANEVAFERLAQMVDAQNARSANVEQQRESFHKAQIKSLERQIEALGHTPATENGGLLDLIGQFMGGMQVSGGGGGMPAAPANGKDG